MHPIRITGPSERPVSLRDVKLHCRIDGDDEDWLLQGLVDAAVGHLDGYRGVLGRCIMPQTWRVDLPGGCSRLPLPDVLAASAVSGTGQVMAAPLSQDTLGSYVTLSEPGTVTFNAAMPDELIPVVRQVILLMVSHWYENREAASETPLSPVPLAVDALLAPIRWALL